MSKPMKGAAASAVTILLPPSAARMYATAFARVGKTLTANQRATLETLRNLDGHASAPAYVYSDPLRSARSLPNSDALFFPPTQGQKRQSTPRTGNRPSCSSNRVALARRSQE